MALTKKSSKKAIRKAWVDALLSGNYKQGKKVLHAKTKNGDRFCCLGVLCELAVKANVIKPSTLRRYPPAHPSPTYYYSDKAASLPLSVRKWAGLRTDCGEYGEFFYDDLASNNDVDGKTFKTIAKIIASEPKGLFE